jgi:hypothetical protein
MISLHGLILFDIAAVMAMLVVAYLSKSMGEALKIPPYFRVLHFTSLLIAVAAIIDAVPKNRLFPYSETVSMVVRCLAGIIALPVCLRYWKWLISEYFKN